MNKAYDETTEREIEEIWNREYPDESEPIRLNGKYVWETARRVCDFVDTHDVPIRITTFGECRGVIGKVTRVVIEAHNVENKRKRTARKKMSMRS